MWKAPNRPNHEISQDYNDGIVTVYSVTDAAQPGYKPEKKLEVKAKLRYAERRVGIQRYYEAKQNQVQVERVIRVQRGIAITNQDEAETEDGKRYAVEQVQTVDGVWPPSLDITLAAIRQRRGGTEE